MSEFVINVVQDPSIIIDVNNSDQTTSLNIVQDQPNSITIEDDANNVLLNPSVFYNGINIVYLSGVSGELLHNTFGDLQGGTTGQYYHLSSGQYFNLTTGAVVRPSETGAFYPANNPSGFITGVDLSAYVTGDVVRPSETGNFITTSQTGVFYPRSNPSGFITGVDLSAYVTGDVVRPSQTGNFITTSQTGAFYASSNPSGFITGVDLSFSGNYYTKSESESRYVNATGAETILGDKTFHDKVYINNLYVTGLETIVNTTNTNVASNYIMLNLTGGAVDGGLFFVTGSGLTGVNDSGAIIGFDHSDKFKFGIGTRASDLSVLSTIASFEEVTGISGNLQTQISTLNNQTGSYVLNNQTGNFITTAQTGQFYSSSNPSGYITGINNLVYATGDQTINGLKTFTSRPTLNGTGFLLSGEAAQLPETIIYSTGNQDISGIKNFLTQPTISGNPIATISDPVRTTLMGNGVASGFAISGASGLINPSALIVAIDGAIQEPIVDYIVNTGSVFFTSPLPSGSKAVVVSPNNFYQVAQVVPSDGSVTSSKLDNSLQINNLTVANNLTAANNLTVTNNFTSNGPFAGNSTQNNLPNQTLANWKKIFIAFLQLHFLRQLQLVGHQFL